VECSISKTKEFRIPQEYHSLHGGSLKYTRPITTYHHKYVIVFWAMGWVPGSNCLFLHDCDAVLADHHQILEKHWEKFQYYKHRLTYQQSILHKVLLRYLRIGESCHATIQTCTHKLYCTCILSCTYFTVCDVI
jgi:hypothetical protein